MEADTNSEEIPNFLQSAYQSFADAVANSIPPKDPLIIDLNNDGINLTSWQESNVRFDLDGDGTTESTGWTQASANIINYQKGDGAIIIDKDTANLADQIVFGSGILKDDLTFSKVEFAGSNIDSDLVISFNDSNNPNDKITIINYFRNPENGYENCVGTPVQLDPFKNELFL